MEKVRVEINKSKIYFTPLFNKEVSISYFNLLRNTYFWYDDFENETFCLLYKFEGKVTGEFRNRKGFTVYEQNILIASPLFKGYRDYGEFVIYEFGLTDELLHYRNLLLEGKYSKIDEEGKKLILKFNGRVYGPNEKEYIRKVLYKDEELLYELAERYNEPITAFPEGTSIIIPEKELFANFVE